MKSINFIFFYALNIIHSLKLDCLSAQSFYLSTDSTYQLAVQSSVPPNSFIIGSFDNSPTLSFNPSDGTWNQSLTYYSLSSYLNSTNVLQISPTTTGQYFFSICSFNSTLNSPINIKPTKVRSCPLNCNNHGVCINNSCMCKSPYFGEDCSLYYTTIKSGYSRSFKISGYSLMFFNLLSSNALYVQEKVEKVHIFIDSRNKIPSFFEFMDYSNPNKSFGTSRTSFFSIFCPQPTPCSFKLYEKENYISSSSIVVIVILICVLSPISVLIIIVIIVYIKKRRTQERLDRCLSSNEISQYAPLTKLQEELENDICSICLSKLAKNEDLRKITACNHYFHPGCLEEWLKIKAKCPNCNVNIT